MAPGLCWGPLLIDSSHIVLSRVLMSERIDEQPSKPQLILWLAHNFHMLPSQVKGWGNEIPGI